MVYDNIIRQKRPYEYGASLEVRVPFADHRLVEYAWNIPWEMKMYKTAKKVYCVKR